MNIPQQGFEMIPNKKVNSQEEIKQGMGEMQLPPVPSNPQMAMTTNEVQGEEDTCYQCCVHGCGNFCGCLRTCMPFPFCCADYPYTIIDQSFVGTKALIQQLIV